MLSFRYVGFPICWVSDMLGFVPQPNLRIKICLIGARILLNNTFARIVPCGVGFLLEYLGGSYLKIPSQKSRQGFMGVFFQIDSL